MILILNVQNGNIDIDCRATLWISLFSCNYFRSILTSKKTTQLLLEHNLFLSKIQLKINDSMNIHSHTIYNRFCIRFRHLFIDSVKVDASAENIYKKNEKKNIEKLIKSIDIRFWANFFNEVFWIGPVTRKFRKIDCGGISVARKLDCIILFLIAVVASDLLINDTNKTNETTNLFIFDRINELPFLLLTKLDFICDSHFYSLMWLLAQWKLKIICIFLLWKSKMM